MAETDKKSINCCSPVGSLNGIGKVRTAQYAKLGIFTVWDLLRHFPRAYENRGNVVLLSEASPEVRSSVILTVATVPRTAKLKGKMFLTKFRAFDESGTCEIAYFNQPYIASSFSVGDTYRFWGKAEKNGNGYSMSSPIAEPYDEEKPLPDLYPVYGLTEGLSQNQIKKDIKSALAVAAVSLKDTLPEQLTVKNNLSSLMYALRTVHSPDSYAALATAKRRLMYDELFTFALGMRLTHEKHEKEPAFACTDTDLSEFVNAFGFEFTDGQKEAIRNIQKDMSEPYKMSRIVVGDVGCGKTVCAAAAMYLAVKNGRQAALMAPTEILARQHYKELSGLFAGFGMKCELLIGATTSANKKRIYEGLKTGDTDKRIDIVIGTVALISDGVGFAAPGVVVTDEQHRFGVRQRAALSEKNIGSHMLVMSATPIPRSLALVMYGDLDISRINDMPPGRSRVDTFVVDESYRARLDGFIRRLVGEGGQVYIVCPSVEEEDIQDDEISMADIGQKTGADYKTPKLKMKAAVTYAGELAERMPDISVAFVHGKMKSAEKDSIMSRFSEGGISVLVSTTVIEVGVNVPNACLMIVENAERFGLSQLHQLRGRVGRGKRKSYCVLVTGAAGRAADGEQSDASKRLETMKNTYDGYIIAEKDLEIRGPGDFIASASLGADTEIRQSGGMKFRLADMCDDSGLLSLAVADASLLIETDPELSSYPELRAEVDGLFTIAPGSIS